MRIPSPLKSLFLLIVTAITLCLAVDSTSTSAAVLGDDYPGNLKAYVKDATADPWNFLNRECTSFCAWRLNNANGVAFSNSYKGVYWGHAQNWGNAARQAGITVDKTPAVGAIAWWDSGTYGHVAWVASVNGSNVTIEEYNYAYSGEYHKREISASNPSGYIHIGDMPDRQPVPQGSQVLPDGKYHILSANNLEFRLDREGNGAATDGTNVQLWTNSFEKDEYFTIKYMNDGFYEISYGDMCLDVSGGGYAYGTNVQMWSRNSSDAQRWVLQLTSDGAYNLISKCNGLYLDNEGGNMTNGNNVSMYIKNGTLNQNWYFVPVGEKTVADGRYYILSAKDTGYRMDRQGNGDPVNETNVQLWTNTGEQDEYFEVKYMGDGSYTIGYGKYMLDVSAGGVANKTNLQMYEDNGLLTQRWIIEHVPGTSECYRIYTEYNGHRVDLVNGETYNGNNIELYSANTTKNQMWYFEPLKETTETPSASDKKDDDKNSDADGKKNSGESADDGRDSAELPSIDYTKWTQTITVADKYNKTVVIKSSKLAKKSVTLALNARAVTSVSYKLVKYPKNAKKYVSVAADGTVTIRKKAPAGTYKIRITAAEDVLYAKATKYVTIKVK